MNLKHTLQASTEKYINFVVILIFIWSLFSVKWNDDLVHSGGLMTSTNFGRVVSTRFITRYLIASG